MDGPAQQIELVRVERDGDRLQAVTEDDGRDLAGLAQMRHRLAGFGPAGGGQDCRGGAHWLDPPARFFGTRPKEPVARVWSV